MFYIYINCQKELINQQNESIQFWKYVFNYCFKQILIDFKTGLKSFLKRKDKIFCVVFLGTFREL